jgi:hypothetical protein
MCEKKKRMEKLISEQDRKKFGARRFSLAFGAILSSSY